MSEPASGKPSTGLPALAVVLVLSALLLSPLLQSGFLTDDYHAIDLATERLEVEDGVTPSNLWQLITLYGRQVSENFQLYRPTVLASYGLTCLLSGTEPFLYQLTNLLLHLVAGLLLFLLIRHVLPGAGPVGAAVACAFFLVSPLQLEVVAWSAARSESLGLCFGLLAILFKIRHPDRMIWPSVFAAASLTAKESSVVFFVVLFVLDVFPLEGRGDGGTLVQRTRTALRRAMPLFVLAVLYLLLRWILFGSLFEANYNRRELDSFVGSDLLSRYGGALWRMLIPFNEDVAREAWWRLPFSVISVAGAAGVIWWGAFRGFRSHGRLLVLVLVLFAVPFFLGILVNDITPKLVNTRAVYTCMAALAILVALAQHKGRGAWKWVPVGCLLLVAVRVSLPHQERYVEAHETIERTLESIRGPLRNCPNPQCRRVAILNYREGSYFGGGFTMSGAIRPALARPFLSQDYHLEKVTSRRQAFEGLLEGDLARTALFVMRRDEENGDLLCEPHAFGTWSAPGYEPVVLVAPGKGAEIFLDPSKPETLSPRFSFRPVGTGLRRIRFEFFASTWRVAHLDLDLESLATRDIDGRTVYEVVVPVSQDLLSRLMEREAFGWTVSGLGPDGSVVCQTGLRLVYASGR